LEILGDGAMNVVNVGSCYVPLSTLLWWFCQV